jgi:hypothetical protein
MSKAPGIDRGAVAPAGVGSRYRVSQSTLVVLSTDGAACCSFGIRVRHGVVLPVAVQRLAGRGHVQQNAHATVWPVDLPVILYRTTLAIREVPLGDFQQFCNCCPLLICPFL